MTPNSLDTFQMKELQLIPADPSFDGFSATFLGPLVVVEEKISGDIMFIEYANAELTDEGIEWPTMVLEDRQGDLLISMGMDYRDELLNCFHRLQ